MPETGCGTADSLHRARQTPYVSSLLIDGNAAAQPTSTCFSALHDAKRDRCDDKSGTEP